MNRLVRSIVMRGQLLGAVGLLLTASAFCYGEVQVAIREIAKPRPPRVEFRARRQPTVPASYKELPFVETVPAPALNKAEQRRGYMLFHRPITESVYPNTHPYPSERLAALTAFATPGEYEPLTFSIYPTRNLKNLHVIVSALTGPNGAAIPQRELSMRLLTYWNIGFPRYTSRSTYRRLPELLEHVNVHSSPAGECQRWWLRVHVPDKTPAGVYRGTVTIWDDGYERAVAIPVALRVLDFSLQRDPAKHYSVYYEVRNRVVFRGKSEAFIRKAVENEYRAMLAYGIDMVPTLRLTTSADGRRAELRYPEELQRMLDLGMTGPVPVTGGSVIGRIYRDTTPGGKYQSHWRITKMPPPEFYRRVTEAFRALQKQCVQKHWPELVCCPLDEVAASRKEFGARVYRAVKEAGIRTYATKNPRAADAEVYKPYIDVWCSQPYSMPYERIAAQHRYEYWSYPNHNAGEIKDRRVMCKGGRMTYGYGFWRSGYTTLIPWHWAWTPAPDQFDYLRGARSGCGQRIGDDGEVIPAVYWECFREGRDDQRYVYTLQQLVWERETTPDPACRKAVQAAKQLLQTTWNDIQVQQKYLASGMWPSSEFQTRRWCLAQAIETLLKFSPVRSGTAPSVLVDTKHPAPKTQSKPVLTNDESAKLRSLLDDRSQWHNSTKEGHIELPETNADQHYQKILRWRVDVDHKRDGGEGGKYPVGWPRMARSFRPGTLDFTDYDLLVGAIRVDSNRDEVADDVTPLRLLISFHQKGAQRYETVLDLGDRQRTWIPIRLSIKDMIQSLGLGAEPWKSVARVQLFIAERDFKDGTSLTFDIGDLSLLRFTAPQIETVDVPRYVMLPCHALVANCSIAGNHKMRSDAYQLLARLCDAQGRSYADRMVDLCSNSRVVLDLAGVAPGTYQLQVEVRNANGDKRSSSRSQTVVCVPGPFYENP